MTTFSHGDEVIRKGEKDHSRIGKIDLEFSSSSDLPSNMVYVYWYDSWRTMRIDMNKIMHLSDFRKLHETPQDLKHYWVEASHAQNNKQHSGK